MAGSSRFLNLAGVCTINRVPASFIAFVSENSTKIDAAIGMFSQFEIIETVRTGKVVMARGEQPT